MRGQVTPPFGLHTARFVSGLWCNSSISPCEGDGPGANPGFLTSFKQRLVRFQHGIPVSNAELGTRSAGFEVRTSLRRLRLFIRTDHDIQTFRACQSALNAVGGEKGFTFEFERQRHVQQIESATAEPFGVPLRQAARRFNC